jgi:hypothetical protein
MSANILPLFDLRSKPDRLLKVLLEGETTIRRLALNARVSDPVKAMRRYFTDLKGVTFKVGPYDDLEDAVKNLEKLPAETTQVSMAFEDDSPWLVREQATTSVERKPEVVTKQSVVFAKTLTIKYGDHKPMKIDKAHKRLPELLEILASGCHVWMAGPAGSGKTMGARIASEMLKRKFYFNGAIDTEYKLSGFVDAHGRINYTPFRRCWEGGGLYLFDEVDASLPSATLAFNAALSGDYCDFPGAKQPVKKHKDFLCIAAANTWGFGGTANYVGRNKQDGAFLDRFEALEWDYDDELERLIAGNDKWVKKVQAYRKAAAKIGLKVVISPRASINGAKMLKRGISEERVIQYRIRAKISEQDWENLEAEVKAVGV